MRTALAALLLGIVSACSSTDAKEATANPYDSVYETAQSDAPDTSEIRGVWKILTTQDGISQEQRLKVTDDTLTITNRCSTEVQPAVTVGVSVGVTVGEGIFTVKDPGGQDTKQAPAAGGKPTFTCIARLKGPGDLPFALGNDELQLGGAKWSKVSD